MKLLLMEFSPFSCYFLSLRSIYSPKYFGLKHNLLFFPQCERHPYKTVGNFVVLCILNFRFLEEVESKRF